MTGQTSVFYVHHWDYDASATVGIYSTAELAQAAIDAYEPASEQKHCTIDEWVLDGDWVQDIPTTQSHAR